MKICIVGHGNSSIGKKLGSDIDAHDVVIRLKNCEKLIGTEDYGNKVTVQVYSTETTHIAGNIKADLYWLYPKNCDYDDATIGSLFRKLNSPVWLPLDLTRFWLEKFLDMGASHPSTSIGTAAFFMAAHFFQPEQITLVGFDTVLSGIGDGQQNRNKVVPRTGTGIIPHDWKKEGELLKVVADSYELSIVTI